MGSEQDILATIPWFVFVSDLIRTFFRNKCDCYIWIKVLLWYVWIKVLFWKMATLRVPDYFGGSPSYLVKFLLPPVTVPLGRPGHLVKFLLNAFGVVYKFVGAAFLFNL